MTVDIWIGKLVKVDEGDKDANGAIVLYDQIVYEYNDDAPAFPGAVKSAHQNLIMVSLFGRPDPVAMLTVFLPVSWRKVIVNSGTLKITKNTVKRFKEIIAAYKRQFPAATPAFDDNVVNNTMARLEVLAWWSKYAVEKYGKDAFVLIS